MKDLSLFFLPKGAEYNRRVLVIRPTFVFLQEYSSNDIGPRIVPNIVSLLAHIIPSFSYETESAYITR
jgi:hypothetical protein